MGGLISAFFFSVVSMMFSAIRPCLRSSSLLRPWRECATQMDMAGRVEKNESGNDKLENRSKWRLLKGFNTFTSVKDVQAVLRKANIDAVLDPMLNKHYYLNGKWAIRFEDVADIRKLNATLNSHQKLETMTPIDANAFYASSFGITNRTVKVRDLRGNVRPSDLLYILEDFEVSQRDLNCVYKNAFTMQYLIHFKTAELAQRFVFEKNQTYVNDRIINVIYYDV